jgi:prenyltransferase beta subunit
MVDQPFSLQLWKYLTSVFVDTRHGGLYSAVSYDAAAVLTPDKVLRMHALAALSALGLGDKAEAAAFLALVADFQDEQYPGFIDVREYSGPVHELGNVKSAQAQLLAALALLSADPTLYDPELAATGERQLAWIDGTFRTGTGGYLSTVSRDGTIVIDDTLTAEAQALAVWAHARLAGRTRAAEDLAVLRDLATRLVDTFSNADGVVADRRFPDGRVTRDVRVSGAASALVSLALAEAATVTGDGGYADRARAVLSFATGHLWDTKFDGYWDHCDLDGRITVHREFITLLNATIPIKTSATNAWLLLAETAVAALTGADRDQGGAGCRVASYLGTLVDEVAGGVFIGEGYFWTPPGTPVGPFERLMLPSRQTPGISHFGASSFLRLYNKQPHSQALTAWALHAAGVGGGALPDPQEPPVGYDHPTAAAVLEPAALKRTAISQLPPVDLGGVVDVNAHMAVIDAACTSGLGYGWTPRQSPLGSQPDRTPSVFGTHHSIANLRVLGGPIRDTEAVARWIRLTQSPNGAFGEYPGGPADVLNTYLAVNALDLLGQSDFGDVSAAVAYLRACQNTDGGFGVVPGFPSDLFHSNLAVVALHTLGASPADVAACVEYHLRAANSDGAYGERVGTPSDVYSVYRAVGTLTLLGYRLPNEVSAIEWLRACQGSGGGFRHDFHSRESLIATYHAVAALSLLGSEPRDVEACRRWLRTCQTPEGTFSNIPGVSSGTIDEGFAAIQSLAILEGGLDAYFAIVVS